MCLYVFRVLCAHHQEAETAYYKTKIFLLLSGFFPRDLPVVKISPEWVTGPEQGKSSGRIATFSLWTGMFRDGISSVPVETVIPL